MRFNICNLFAGLALMAGCTAPAAKSKLIPAHEPWGAQEVIRQAWYGWYGEDRPLPRITYNNGAEQPCGDYGTFLSSKGECVWGETAYYEGLPDTAEIRVSVRWDWPGTLAHELLHYRFMGGDAWGNPDFDHTRPEWKDILPQVQEDARRIAEQQAVVARKITD